MNAAYTTTSFTPQTEGAVTECHTMVHVTDTTLTFDEQLRAVTDIYHQLYDGDGQTPLFRRFFLSDAANQQPVVEQALESLEFCATSIVQQPPLDGTKIALWVWSASGMVNEAGGIDHNGYHHYWMGGCIPYQRAGISALNRLKNFMGYNGYAPAHNDSPVTGDPEYQMRDIFDAWRCELKGMDMTIADHGIRTWIFVHDVDVNYKGVVDGRRKYFKRIGLTPKTHFLASTGIEGRHAMPDVLVQMDGYAVRGLRNEQIRQLYAKEYLNPTYEYGVTFERGTAVTYGDRRHVFISGTASIDNKGNVLHVGDIRKQTLRMLENVQALLAEAECTMDDIASAIVYLRDPADAGIVRQLFHERHPALNYVLVHAPVCRPTWLIEMECIALKEVSHPEFSPL